MRKWIIAILLIVVFIFSIMAGFIVNSFINFSKHEEQSNHAVLAEDKTEEVIDTSSNEVIVSPNAEIVLTQSFKKCGHTITTKDIAPRDIVNLNQGKVQEYYADWNIDEFNSNEIKLSRNNSGICDEHYILRESDGYISISCKNNIGEYIFKGLTDISVQYLTEEDLANLEEGIEVVGRESLNKLLEDFE